MRSDATGPGARPTATPAGHAVRRRIRSLLALGLLAPLLGAQPTLAQPAPAQNRAVPMGVYGANNPKLVRQFEEWLGCPVDQLLVFTDQASWEGIGWPQWFIDQFKELNKPALWSIAMIPKGASLQAAATGAYNRYYVTAAKALAQTKPFPDGTIRIRMGWELNGDWFPWAAEGKEREFIATFRHIVNAFRSVSDKFRFEWNINYGQRMDPLTAYPGDDYVDIIGMDFYWKTQYLPTDPVAAFAAIRDNRYGLRYIENFAKERGKPTAYSEWGIQGNNAGPFIKLLQEWMSRHNVLYHNYWNSDADYAGQLSAGRWPETAQAFRAAFCPTPNKGAAPESLRRSVASSAPRDR